MQQHMIALNTSLTTKIALLFALIILSMGVQSLKAQDPVDKFYALSDSAWDFRSAPRPLDPDSGPDDKRTRDMSFEAIEVREQFWNEVVNSLAKMNAAEFPEEDRINYEVFRYIAEETLAGYEFATYLLPFNAEGGFHTAFGYRAGRTSIGNSDAMWRYIRSLKEFDMQVNQQIALMRKGLELNYRMPCVIIEGFDNIAESYVTSAPEESVFWQPVASAQGRLAPSSFDSLESEARVAINEHVFPAYKILAEFLREEYIAGCRDEIGTSLAVDGEDFYTSRIRYFTTLQLSPKEVFEIGLSEVKRIRSEMEGIIEEVGFDGTFTDFLDFLRSDQRFYAKTPRELLSHASYFAKKIDGALPGYFGTLPRLSYGVESVPDEIAPRYTGGRYVPGDAESGRAGTYWVNTYKLESRPLYVLPSLTLHEAVPGHHLQISLAAELEDLPEFRSQYYISAFGEGWALYTEFLGKEMGIYETPYERFGALTYEMWRACRLVVDPGMHVFGWSRDSAVQFMAENTALSIHEVNTEINRYIGWPGQAVSYKIGELKIRELRELAEQRLGDQFDLREFHDTVLANGSIPLFVLERIIHDWIAAETTKGRSGKSD